MNNKQFSIGAIISYIIIFINSIYGLFVTPFLLQMIGTSEFGVYKAIGAFSASLAIIDLGIGSTVIRYISVIRSENDYKKIENYTAMAFIQTAFIIIFLISISSVFYPFIPQIFGKSFTVEEIKLAEMLFIILILNMSLNIVEKVFFGILIGSNHFIFGNSIKLFRVIFKIVFIFSIISYYRNAVFLVLIETVVVTLAIFFQFFYVKKKIKINFKLHYFDKKLFFESLTYSFLIFIYTLAVQFNGNVDNIIIGALIGTSAVAVYSISLQLWNMYQQFATSFSNLMFPTISNKIANNADNFELENTVIKVGRYQFVFMGAVLAGFFVLGKEFIFLWVGDDFSDAYIIALILMVPTIIPIIQNVCLTIIRVKNKIKFKTYAHVIMAIFNLIITYFGVKYFGYIAAAVGTAAGLIAVNIIAMNIYYIKVIKLDVFRIFREIFRRTWICVLLPTITVLIFKNFIDANIISFLIMTAIFIMQYSVLLWAFGFNLEEKKFLRSFIGIK